MKILRRKQRVMTLVISGAILSTCLMPVRSAQQYRIPYLRQHGTATQLVVDDKPFLVLAGELGNSTSSSLDYMRPFWPKLASLNLNTVLVPVYWELLEPAEGKFDFTLVDGLIQEACKHKLASRTAVVCVLEKQHVVLCPGLGESKSTALPSFAGQDRQGHRDPFGL
jgi:hypothetical protein